LWITHPKYDQIQAYFRGYEMKKYSNLEKKLKLVVYPKVLHSGKVVNPMDFDKE
jgi:hypothetical protein